MNKVTLLDKSFKTFISNEKIEVAVNEVAERINSDFEGSTDVPVLLCVLNGAMVFTAELMNRLRFNCELVCIKLTSYQGTSSTGKVHEVMGMTGDVKGKRVIVVEDIVDTGTTIVDLTKMLAEMEAGDVKICTLLLKPEVYRKEVPLDYVGIRIPDVFIVGFGLDYNGMGRNLRDIYVIDK